MNASQKKVVQYLGEAQASEQALVRVLQSQIAMTPTAKLAASICADEEKMLQRVLREIPKLTDAVVRAEVEGNPSFDVTKTGSADAVREAGEVALETARTTGARAKRSSRQARKLPGVTQTEGQIKGAMASEADLAITRYDTLTAEDITGKLAELSQIDLAKIDTYERKNQNRTTVLSRISALRTGEPWAGYDELTAAEVQAVLSEGDDDRAQQVRSYERSHKNRASVLKAAERELASA